MSLSDDDDKRRERILQYLKMLSYAMSIVVMGVVAYLGLTQAQIMKNVSQMMTEAADSMSDSSDYDSSDYSSDE